MNRQKIKSKTGSSSIQTVIITGGNSGLGLASAKTLLTEKTPLHVVIACRDTVRANIAIDELKKIIACGSNVETMQLDLATLTSVRSFAQKVEQRLSDGSLPPLHSVVCNAGTQSKKRFTVDGFEETFAVNNLGHYLLVNLLLPFLTKPARIVVVASGVHDPAQFEGIPSFATVPVPSWNETAELAKGNLGSEAKNDDEATDMGRRYSTSKLASIYFTYGLAARLPEGITVNAFDPGLMPGTGLAREYSPVMRFMWYYIMPNILPLMRWLVVKNVHSPKDSGSALARLITDTELADTNGKYFEGLKEIRSSEASYDVNRADEFWKSSALLTGLTESSV